MTTTAVDSEAFGEAHRRLLADPSLQFTLPDAQSAQPPAWLEPLLRFLETYGGVLKPLFYGLLIAGAAWFAWQVGKLLYARWRERGPAVSEAAWRPQAAAARALLDEADALAAAGRYGEAARLLLFRSIEDIDAHRPGLVRGASTSREIAGAEALPADARGAFGTIAALVERSLFARGMLDAGGWREARDAYGRFAFGGRRG